MAASVLAALQRRRRVVEVLRKNLEILGELADALARILEANPNHPTAAEELELLNLRRERIEKGIYETEQAMSSSEGARRG